MRVFGIQSADAAGGGEDRAAAAPRPAGEGGAAIRRRGFLPIFVLGIAWVGAGGVQAQTATLAGRITDEQGAGLAGARVAADSPAMAAPAVVTSGANGVYEVTPLAPGVYTIIVSLSGFEGQRREDVTLGVGETRTLDVRLVLAPFAERVDVVGVAPLPGAGVGRDRVPATVSVIEAADLEARGAASLPDALLERLGAITVEAATTNLFQPTLRFRGFTASPLLGLPQGIAVYQNGVRINEPFGDTVQFDLVPLFALDRIQLSAGAEPTYGLNALGGAIALRLKNGFDSGGVRGEFSGGSFGRVAGTAELGAERGRWAVYLGATRFHETGWRVASASDVTQAVADIGYRADRVDAGVNVIYATTRLNGNGPAPVELLDVDRSAVFTFPDTTRNELAMWQGRLDIEASPIWSVQATGYYRDLDRRTLNGDEAEFAICGDAARPPGAPIDTLCFGPGDDDPGVAPGGSAAVSAPGDPNDDASTAAPGDRQVEADPIVDTRTGHFITADDAVGDGALNRTRTLAAGYGAAIQATATTQIGDRDNVLVVGASADLADVAFTSRSEVGTLTVDRTVVGSGLFAGIFGEAPDDLFNTEIDTENRALGLYVSETLSLTDRVHVTVSGRFNRARVGIVDALGTSLDGRHVFSRFNPGAGAVYGVTDAVSVFARYAESNRAPTAAELSCADPAEPCRVPNAFVSDPPLEQAAARSVEAGVRAHPIGRGAGVDWSFTAYRTRIRDDILFVASPELIGTGFFQNAGDTQRVGLDAELTGRMARLDWFASYALVEATFESPLRLPGDRQVNDAATAAGELVVEPGDRLPGIPRHSLKAGLRVDLTDAWDAAVETIVSSSRVFVGDEGNDQSELEGYGLVNLRSSFGVRDNVDLLVRVDNLFDTTYASFGVLADLGVDLVEVPDASDPRFVGPGAPRSAFAGLRLRF